MPLYANAPPPLALAGVPTLILPRALAAVKYKLSPSVISCVFKLSDITPVLLL